MDKKPICILFFECSRISSKGECEPVIVYISRAVGCSSKGAMSKEGLGQAQSPIWLILHNYSFVAASTLANKLVVRQGDYLFDLLSTFRLSGKFS